jgi:tetratricopeptide (TPR) repeat protein
LFARRDCPAFVTKECLLKNKEQRGHCKSEGELFMETQAQPIPGANRRRPIFLIFFVSLLTALLAIAGLATMRWQNTGPSLNSVEAAFRTGDLDAASLLVADFVQRNHDDVRGRMLQADIAERRKDFPTAAAAYQVLLKSDSASPKLHHHLARALLESAEFERAEKEYRAILQRNPRDEAAQTEIQWMLFHQQRVRELEDFLEACLAGDPNSRLLYHLLVSAQKPPNPLESLPVLEKIDAAVPGQSSIQLGLARCAWRMGDIPRARKLFAAVEQKRGSGPDLAFTLAEFELEQSNIEAAENYLKTLDDLASFDAKSDDRWWWLSAQLAQHRRNFPQALTAVTEANRLRPRELRYLHLQATLLQILGQSEEAAALHSEVEARRKADRELYEIVHHTDLNQVTTDTLQMIARNCRILKKTQQAEYWEKLAPVSGP